MAAYLGNHGFIELKRDGDTAAINTELNESDVNVAKQRFSVDYSDDWDADIPGTGSQVVPLITGDRVAIATLDKSPLELVRNNIDSETDAGSKVTADSADLGGTGSGTFKYAIQEVDASNVGLGAIVNGYISDSGFDYTDGSYSGVSLIAFTSPDYASGPGSGATADIVVKEGLITSVTIVSGGSGYAVCPYFPDILHYVHVDEMGALRLFTDFSTCLAGKKDQSLELIAPTSAQQISITNRNQFEHCLAQVQSFSFTTSRESVDVTRLGDEFRRQHEGGLITGQGRITAFWDFRFRLCETPLGHCGGSAPEFAQYLAQLCIRISEGASFSAKLFIYYPGDTATIEGKEPSVWYEMMAQVTNCSMEVSAEKLIMTDIEFVTTSAFGLFSDKPPLFLLMEGSSETPSGSSGFANYVLDQDGNPIMLQDVD